MRSIRFFLHRNLIQNVEDFELTFYTANKWNLNLSFKKCGWPIYQFDLHTWRYSIWTCEIDIVSSPNYSSSRLQLSLEEEPFHHWEFLPLIYLLILACFICLFITFAIYKFLLVLKNHSSIPLPVCLSIYVILRICRQYPMASPIDQILGLAQLQDYRLL